MVKGVSAEIKWRRKKWYNIEAPQQFQNTHLGQTPADDEKKLINRVIETTGHTLLNDPTKQNKKIYFKITQIKNNTAQTKFHAYKLADYHVKKLVRRGSSKIYARQETTTKNNEKIIIKTIAMTATKCENKKKQQLRKQLITEIEKETKNRTLENLIHDTLKTKIQTKIKKTLTKTHPIKLVEIIKIETKK